MNNQQRMEAVDAAKAKFGKQLKCNILVKRKEPESDTLLFLNVCTAMAAQDRQEQFDRELRNPNLRLIKNG